MLTKVKPHRHRHLASVLEAICKWYAGELECKVCQTKEIAVWPEMLDVDELICDNCGLCAYHLIKLIPPIDEEQSSVWQR